MPDRESVFENPYTYQASLLSQALTNPAINAFEHQVNWPRMKAMLPSAWAVRSILDFGCGPGNFTQELAEMYPRAEVVGADVSAEILPAQRELLHGRLRFVQWGGLVPGVHQEFHDFQQDVLGRTGTFDLIVAKMSLHYMEDAEIIQGWLHLLNPRTHVLFSLPHPDRAPLAVSQPSTRYQAEIGNTGMQGVMFNRTTRSWLPILDSTFRCTPHRTLIDEPSEASIKKRLNVLLCPVGTDFNAIAARLARLEGCDGPSLLDRALGRVGLSSVTLKRNSQKVKAEWDLGVRMIKEGRLVKG